jgi:hypothetical protein
MNFDDGEIAFRNSANVGLDENMAENMLAYSGWMIQTFSPGVFALLNDENKDPEEAFMDCIIVEDSSN